MTAEWLITAFFLMPCSPTNFCASFLFLLSRAGFWIWTEFDSFFLLPTIRKNVAHLSKKHSCSQGRVGLGGHPGAQHGNPAVGPALPGRGPRALSFCCSGEPPEAFTNPNPLNELAWLTAHVGVMNWLFAVLPGLRVAHGTTVLELEICAPHSCSCFLPLLPLFPGCL